ncbi:YdeI/OmpD-associated family protein [Parapedobacter pyrenivorans]|uniref:YdeI/OmpD-associated family protein n=1 Tax=Parapedobacter pyrenivorans TaxID=1305674 RepID=UPI0033413743
MSKIIAPWQEELAALQAIIQKTALEETIKWGIPVYTHNGRNVVGVAGFKSHFTLWFYNGVFLKDESNVLTNAQEGKTKSLRQWRFTAQDQIDEALILAYLNEAIANEKAGKQLESEPKAKLSMPPQFEQALKDLPLRQHFERLTPYKKNEYVEYITEAKQETTKLARIERIKPLILQGMGLHDKYKK